MEPQVDNPKLHLVHILLFEFNKGSNVAEAFQAISQVYGKGAISETAAHRLFAQFGQGIFDLKDIPYICDDIWLDCYRLLAHDKVGLEMALVSGRFDELVDTHLISRKFALGEWEIQRSENGDCTAQFTKYKNDGTKIRLPIPQGPLPDNVVGFEKISISYINFDVIVFLHSIRHFSGSSLFVFTSIFAMSQQQNWQFFAILFLPMMNVFEIAKIRFDIPRLDELRTRISPYFLCDCANLRMVTCAYTLLEFPPDDSDGASEGQALTKWLHTTRADGRPKATSLGNVQETAPSWIEQLKTVSRFKAVQWNFVNATTSVNFIIIQAIAKDAVVVPFEVENWRTREQLKFWEYDTQDTQELWYNKWLIERGPIERNFGQWDEWRRELFCEDWNVIEFNDFAENDCLPPAVAQEEMQMFIS